MKDWKEKLDPVVKDYLNDLLKKVVEHRDAYRFSKDKKISQIWVALAILYRELNSIKNELIAINGRIDKIEEELKGKQEKKSKKKESKIKELIKTLEQF